MGTWSGRTATCAASRALSASWARHHPMRTTGTVGASATMRIPRHPPARPVTIHGRRMPSRDEVRSLSLPKNGFPRMDTMEPVQATSARLFGACSIPTSELTFKARETRRGARNIRDVPMDANAYREMKPRPTRSSGSGSTVTSAADLELWHLALLAVGGSAREAFLTIAAHRRRAVGRMRSVDLGDTGCDR